MSERSESEAEPQRSGGGDEDSGHFFELDGAAELAEDAGPARADAADRPVHARRDAAVVGPPPLASNLNYRPGEVVPGQATVGLGPGADVCFTSLADVDLIVDVTGTYGP